MADDTLPQPAGPLGGASWPVSMRQLFLILGLAAAVAATVAVVLWSQAPNYTPVYPELSERDASEVVAALQSGDVPYRLDAGTGAVLVPSTRLREVRMQLAASGLPRGSGFGVGSLPDSSALGQSPFMESAMYTHALETELSRTIAELRPVQSARVHLALPPRSAFVRERREPSASVMVELFPGRVLEQAQVDAVVHLVASSIPDLPVSNVTVVDQRGGLLTRSNADDLAGLSSSQFDYTRRVEQDYVRRIEALLTPVVGSNRVRASVAAQLDFTRNEETRESFDPNVSVLRSENTSEQIRRGEDIGAQGVPGALTNQPPEAPAPAAAAGQQQPASEISTSRSATRNFELDKTISHTQQAMGTVQRLSIAVLVDNKAPEGGTGEGQPLSAEELEGMTELVKQSVGFDEARGDTIQLQNAQFQAEPPLPAAEPPGFLEQPWIWDAGRQLLGVVLALLLTLIVVKPLVTNITKPEPPPPALPPGVTPAMLAAPPVPEGYDQRMAAARGLVGQDPRQVAQVVRGWVGEGADG